MNRSPAFRSLRAFVALLVMSLQLLGALHFSLVKHSYSAALGGVVHVHAPSRVEQTPNLRIERERWRTTTLTNAAPSCIADLCQAANAPQSSAPQFEPLAAGSILFGDVRLLSERSRRTSESLLRLLSAPKTSPPA